MQQTTLLDAPYLAFLSEFLKHPHESTQELTACFKAANYTIRFLSEPGHLHDLAACEILQESGFDTTDGKESARELLRSEIITECKKLALIAQQIDPHHFMTEERVLLDQIFSRHLAKIGDFGKKLGSEINAASIGWYQTYKNERNALSLFRLWADPDMPPYYCRYLKLLAETLWKDRVETMVHKTRKHLSAVTQSVQRPLCRFMSPHSEILIREQKPSVLFEGKIVAETAAIDPKLIPLITKGTKSLSSIYHHKLIRFECKKGFENWVRGINDPNAIRLDGGETEIAEILGFKFKEAPSIIKSLLHAQAHMNFTFDDGSRGNLIELKDYRSCTTNREQGVEILLSEQLMPYYTFQTSKRSRLLIPLPDFPPFVSAPQYHAGQALLQMLVMEEFTHQSIEFAACGSIEISRDQWDTLFRQSGLPESIFKQTLARWLIDGNDGPRFLSQIEIDRFGIGEEYAKERNFLKSQGLHRLERQRQGRISVKKRSQLQNSSFQKT